MNWREVAVTVSAEAEETVADLFYQLGCTGVNIEDSRILQAYIKSGSWDYHDFGEVDLTGTVVIKGYFAVMKNLGKIGPLGTGANKLAEIFPNWRFFVKGINSPGRGLGNAWQTILTCPCRGRL